ncbi:hypothetical protein Cgig2_008703 [Carnegiea gigantea]|uniref:Protein TSSC4 n=1 Tax=Carnegiea gigantea TaxID=171969 RepID=A0A9Q1GZF5_9CARY|nr:hypothetical protein Cgig2_008703 [Carnegiea gigantea]
MASSSSSESEMNMNDEAFSERVKKTFGSLFASLQPSPSSLSNPLWSLTGAEVEKKEWRRDKDTSARDSTPCSSSFGDFLSQALKNSSNNLRNYRKELEDDLQDLDDADDEDSKRDSNDWDVRSSIGMDSTLDNEEEEDTYDKVATGRENAGDRLYMRDIIDHRDTDFKSDDDIPGAVGNRRRDPRANLWAAKVRLKEDDVETAAQADRPKPEQAPPQQEEQSKPQQVPPPQAEKESAPAREDCDKLKPILKRKELEATSKPSKRVRFDPGCLSASDTVREASGDIAPPKAVAQDNGSTVDEKVSRVPDYVQNPSKYTRYRLDSVDEMNDKSNTGAFMEFLEMVKRSKNGGSGSEQTNAPMELPKSVTFVPKRKPDANKFDILDNGRAQDKGSDAKRSSMQPTLVGLSAEEDLETEVGDMEVDEPKANAEPDGGATFKKQGRQYRSKSRSDEEA